ncbi:DUF6732 family protein [Pseudooctadecabacter jejudonensis]|uniref:Gram-positive cocci surface proteins LPxTG domain-containing protein n=1 Tax=Pseudooctadecabacter jejudonensis TaxID=1391910 RepID=A0A1Y5S0U9_9RHOB|nr:DUF6732 family protein [Pseudooctadecabacter jejudonensis]SLN29516.1 hypothetical protein PSJ8397_01294 [Pseudooctadecabacter jejudonensis]
MRPRLRPILAALIPTATLIATPALAHIGHLGEVAGHGHWIALGGIAIAGAIALLGGRKKADENTEDATPEASIPGDAQEEQAT